MSNTEFFQIAAKYYKYCDKYYLFRGSPEIKKLLYDKMEYYRELTFKYFSVEYLNDGGTDW